MMENIGGGEILLILIVILIFFGPKKIPELAASLGKGLRKFNEAKDGFETQIKTVMKEPLDAINDAKAGFEAKVKEASQPLRDVMLPQASLSTANAAPSGALPSATVPIPEVESSSAIHAGVSTTPGVVYSEPIAVQSIPSREA